MFGQEDIGIDLGTATALVYIKGRGVVLREPAMVAVDRHTRSILAVGEDVKRMQGRTPGHIVVLRPLGSGAIEDLDLTASMVRYFIHKAIGRKVLFRPRAFLCLPGGLNDVEMQSIITATLDAGARRAFLIDPAVAAALGAGLDIKGPYGSMLVDIGGGITDIAVVSLRRAMVRNITQPAGDQFDDTLIRYLRKKHNLVVGERTAEELKLTIGAAIRRTEKLYMDVTGRSLVSGMPKVVRIHSDEVFEALEEPVHALVEKVQGVLERTPPELAADIFDHGITLTGSGANLFGLSEALTQALKVSFRVAEDPEACVAQGLGRVMESEQDFAAISVRPRQPKSYMSA